MSQITTVELLLIVLIVMIGFRWYIRIAWKQRNSSWTFSRFFLGGKNLGPDLTEQNNWGLTFAWANGIWFFVYLAYSYGPGVILLQIPWCISVGLLSIFLKYIMRIGENLTIHGYIGKLYGSSARKVACIATSIGYIFNFGFEIFMASLMFCVVIGDKSLLYPTAIILSVVCAGYCIIGGYAGSCRTDKRQNIIGMISVTLLCLLAGYNLRQIPGVFIASVILAIICTVYSLIGVFFSKIDIRKGFRIQNALSIFSVPLLAAIILWLNSVKGISIGNNLAPLKIFANSFPPWQMILGISIFQFFFNSVDMANWQSISANTETAGTQRKELNWSFVRSAIYMLWFPAFSGILLGCMMRFIPSLSDQNIFPAIFSHILPGYSQLLTGIVFGIIFLGLFSTSLSSADTYLMAAAMTLNWDLFNHKKYEEIVNMPAGEDRLKSEAKYIGAVRRTFIPLAIFMLLIFALGYRLLPNNIIAFQFIMYGSALALFPCVIYGLSLQAKNLLPNPSLSKWVVSAILIGILAAIVPYILLYLTSHTDLSNWTPVYTIVTASAVFLIGWSLNNKPQLSTFSEDEKISRNPI
jgi:hypothetical protein